MVETADTMFVRYGGRVSSRHTALQIGAKDPGTSCQFSENITPYLQLCIIGLRSDASIRYTLHSAQPVEKVAYPQS